MRNSLATIVAFDASASMDNWRMQMRVTGEAERRLAALPQFHGIPTGVLLRIVKLRTGLIVTSRWTAISLILSNRCPIPVPNPSHAAAQIVGGKLLP